MTKRPPSMRFAFVVALAAAAIAAAPAAAQTLVIPPSSTGAEVGPFGADAAYAFTTSLIGQSFVAQNARLLSFTFILRNEVGAAAAPQFRAYVADYDPLNGAIGTVRFASDMLAGPMAASYAPLTVTPNATLTAGLSYIAYLSGVTSTSGVSYVATNETAPYASGVLVYDVGGGALYADASQEAAFTAVFAPAVTAAPEPATLALVAGGLVGLAARARRRRRVRVRAA